MDDSRENRVAGAVGFNVRTGNYHVFKSKTVICGAGGASNIFKPRSVGEGSGRTWYAPWSSASAYGLMIDAGAKMTQMENRIVLARFKDGYGPVGAYFLHLKTYTQNCLGEEYESKWFPDLQKMVGKEYLDPEASHLTHRPIPTCLRNHCIISEVNAGRGPIHMVTMRAFQDPHLEEVGWENFLGMTVGQAVLWAATDVDPKNENPELTTSEPYVMGSHATCSGAWCSGPEDVSPPEYFWGYNRMTTIEGLFGAGDAVGGTPHAFSSGSFTEGRLAAKAACKYIDDGKAEGIVVSDEQISRRKAEIFKPMEHYRIYRNAIVAGDVNPHYINPRQGLDRLQKLMDEYCGGVTVSYMTNEKLLNIGLKKLKIMEEDLENLAAKDIHELLRAWELKHRHRAAECVTQHTLFRKETRWPGYYYRGDAMKVDDANWHVLTVSRRDPKSGEYTMEKAPWSATRNSMLAVARLNITEKTDEEILAIARPLWRDLVKSSNEGKYGEFARNFSSAMALAMNQVVAGHQFANSELARNLSEEVDALGIIRRGEHVTVLYRQRSTRKPGEWLGRLVLGYEDGKVRIFGATIF
jgi:adenylylsulfate reductase subunit A